MPATPAMYALQNRVDSFKKTKRVKRYPSKKTSTQAASVKWTHPASYKANANTLAEAGFFFSPSWDDRDCVACFLCGKELSDWDEEDDPFSIHYEKCADVCGWALVRCGLVEDMEEDGNFTFVNKARIPTTKAIEEARLQTFGEDWWPHDGDDHGANSRKMAQAGFVYTPQSAGDDTVTCLYCNLALGGWDKDDDPIHEHRKRATKSGNACPFFSFFSQPGPPTRLGRSESTRGKKGAAASQKQTKAHSRTRSRKEEQKAEKKGKGVKQKVESNPQPDQGVLSDTSVGENEVFNPPSPAPAPAPIPSTPEPIPPIPEPTIPTPAPTVTPPTSAPAIPTRAMATPAPVPAPNPNPDTPIAVEDNVFYNPPVPVLPPSLEVLTMEERELTVEQWIRREISLSYDKLLADGQRQIHLFKERSAETRRRIDEL